MLVGFKELSYVLCLIFFFQAEDGIRDYKVTGVQTCALPISARVVNAYGFVYFGVAVHRLRRRERDFSKWDVNVPIQFSSDVNLFRIWEVVAASGDRGFFGTVIRTHRCTGISRDPSTSLGMTKSGTQISGSKIIRVDSCPFVVKQKARRGRAWLSCQSGNR